MRRIQNVPTGHTDHFAKAIQEMDQPRSRVESRVRKTEKIEDAYQ